MTAPLPPNRNRWLTNPSTAAAPLGVGIGLVYLASVVTVPEGTLGAFLALLAAALVVLNVVADAVEQARLTTLKRLCSGALAPDVAALTLAARETAQSPDTAFFIVLASFMAGAALVALGWALIADVPAALALRVGVIGVLVAPLTAMMANLLVLPRARQILRELMAAGLPPGTLAEALPSRFELRRRLVLFACISVLTPMLIVADASLHRANELLELVRSAPDAAAGLAVYQARSSEGLWSSVGLGAAAVLMVVACGWLSGAVLGGPLSALSLETERLAGARYQRGRLVMAEHETWAAATAMSAMEEHLLDVGAEALEASRAIDTAADELVKTGAQQELGAAQQSAALMATTATTEELAHSARQIASNAQQVLAIARATLADAQRGKASADAFTQAMAQVREGNQAIADSVVRLNKRVQQVGRIIEFIDGIADKSDLLALNAELEGHKAGAVGAGFGLVAAEMRRLAENVMTSTREIARLIEDIRDATNAAVMATEAGVKATDTGAALAGQVSLALADIVDFANRSTDAMQSITFATEQQQAGSDQLVAAMEDINRTTRRNADAAELMARTQQDLVVVAKELKEVVETLGGGRDAG